MGTHAGGEEGGTKKHSSRTSEKRAEHALVLEYTQGKTCTTQQCNQPTEGEGDSNFREPTPAAAARRVRTVSLVCTYLPRNHGCDIVSTPPPHTDAGLHFPHSAHTSLQTCGKHLSRTTPALFHHRHQCPSRRALSETPPRCDRAGPRRIPPPGPVPGSSKPKHTQPSASTSQGRGGWSYQIKAIVVVALRSQHMCL